MLHENIEALDQDIASDAYQDHLQHLSDELRILDLKLLRMLHNCQQYTEQDQKDSARSFFISEEEVLALLERSPAQKKYEPNGRRHREIDDIISALERQLAEKSANANGNTAPFPLQRLEKIFSLDRFEIGVLVMALAQEIDKKYERIYAYFNDDLNKKAPQLDLALNTLCSGAAEKGAGFGYFSAQAPLLSFKLIRFVNNHDEESFLSMRFKIEEGIKRFLLGEDSLHPRLLPVSSLEYPDQATALTDSQVRIQAEIRKILSSSLQGGARGMVFWLHGKSGIEKKAILAALCGELDIPLLVANLEDVSLEHDQASTLRLLFREAILKSAALFFTAGDSLSGEEERNRSLRRLTLKAIKEFSWFTFIDAQDLWAPDDLGEAFDWYPMEVKAPDYFERKKIWSESLQHFDTDEATIDAVSCRYAFDESQILRVANYLKLVTAGKNVTLESLLQACGRQSSRKPTKYSKKVSPHYGWDDLVLPEDKLAHLREICSFLKNKHLVYFKWGFNDKLALGRGLNILFTGPSGTGKTMTAEIIASDLRLDLHKADLSSIVSKYIGETEKNLNRIFDETSAGNAILFFDEADALFGKRSEVKDAHDRFANIEINYLLQKMEEHESVVILSTNFGKNLDDAFLRRMQFTVEFPFPDEKHRELLWRKIFPAAAPLSEEIDYKYFSKKLKVSGGNIKNIALASAFLAAEESAPIEMKHILSAAKREYQKIGKAFVKSDFAPYAELIGNGSL